MLFRATIMMSGFLGVLAIAAATSDASSDYRLFDPLPAWPLCGRITENPPPGWTASQGCPSSRWGNPDYSDLPAHTTFGPRQLVSEGDRYDFHRGLDLATPIGTPVFAMARGVVRIAGHDSSYEDPLIMIRHYRPGTFGSCNPDGCYHSLYLHLSGWVVDEDDEVQKGQLIGYTGESENDFEHLHFEVRDGQPEDPSSSWQRDAIHPLRIMPYHITPGNTEISIPAVDTTNPLQPRVTVFVRQPAATRRLDVGRVEVEVYDRASQTAVAQSGVLANANGYHVNPPWLDLEVLDREYTHKNSSAFPWSSFSVCPYAADHGGSYSASVHLDKQAPGDSKVGQFNGVRVQTNRFNSTTSDYELTVEFTALTGVSLASNLCIVANVRSANSMFLGSASWNCSP